MEVRGSTRRGAVTFGLAAVAASALFPSTSFALPDTAAVPVPASVELMEEALAAISDGDASAYETLVDQAFDGSVWLPSAAIIALDDRDVEDIVFWTSVIDSSGDELLGDWASTAIENERDALAELDDDVQLTLEQSEDIDDADSDGAVVLEIIEHRGIFISEPTRKVLTSSLAADGTFPDDIVYERALRDIDARAVGPDGATRPPPMAETNTTRPDRPPSAVVIDDIELADESPVALGDPDQPTVTVEASPDPVGSVAAEAPTAASPSAQQSSSLLMVIAIALAAAALLVGLISAIRGRKTDRLADIAFTDGLTGLSNRRRLDADVIAQRERGYRATSALMVDVDHFKKFNDTHGHDMGDEVLRLVGDVLSREFRKSDVPYRYGGEEFCILLNDVTTDEARIAGERLRLAVEAIELPISERITVSIGVSTGPAMELPSTIKRADGALYDAKDAGRNRVEDG